MSDASYWSTRHDAMLLDGVDPKRIADLTRRTLNAVISRRRALLRAQEPDIVAAVQEHWTKIKPAEIATMLGCHGAVVRIAARNLNLGTNGFGRSGEAGSEASAESMTKAPSKPRGYTDEQLAWMDDNPDHPEAGMMLVLHSDHQAWKQARARS